MRANECFCIYMIPYKDRRGEHMYVGYTQNVRVVEREQEHVKRDKRRHYAGPMHVIGIVDRGNPSERWCVLVDGSPLDIKRKWPDHAHALKTQKDAMAAERFVKRQSKWVKKQAYKKGEPAGQFLEALHQIED